MSFDDFLALVRSQTIRLTIHYSLVEGRILLDYTSQDITLEGDILEVIRANQGMLWLLMQSSDIAVCMDTANHKPYHVQATRLVDDEYVRCDECVRIRKSEEPTDDEFLGRPPGIDLRAQRQ
jgi:hypothetical protein